MIVRPGFVKPGHVGAEDAAVNGDGQRYHGAEAQGRPPDEDAPRDGGVRKLAAPKIDANGQGAAHKPSVEGRIHLTDIAAPRKQPKERSTKRRRAAKNKASDT